MRTRRRIGDSMCSRQRSERNIAEGRVEAASAAEEEVIAAAEDVEETRRQLAEGLIQRDGSQPPPKRKRQSGTRAPGSRRSTGGGEKPSGDGAAKRGRPSEGGGKEGGGKEGDKPAKKAKAEGKESGSAEKKPKAEKEPKPKKAVGKKNEKEAFYEAGAIVEVGLRLGEAYANWYEAQLLELIKGRWKVALQRRSDDGVFEALLLQGRPAAEWAKLDMIRPLPPPEMEWMPAIGDQCELLFDDGWWKVKVQEAGGGEYTVHYAPANAVHTVPRARLRPIFTWDAEAHKFSAIKPARR